MNPRVFKYFPQLFHRDMPPEQLGFTSVWMI